MEELICNCKKNDILNCNCNEYALIANFLNVKYEKGHQSGLYQICSKQLQHKKELKYISDWNQLMSVISFINIMCWDEEQPYRNYFNKGNCLIFVNGDLYVCGIIEEVLKEVIRFIKWYNNQNHCVNCGFMMGEGYSYNGMSEDGVCSSCEFINT